MSIDGSISGRGHGGEVVAIGATGGAAHVIDPTQVPRYSVTPQVAGVDCPGFFVNCDTTATHDGQIKLIRTSLMHPADDAVAANRLSAGSPYVVDTYPDSVEQIHVPADGSDGNIVAVYVLVLGMYGSVTDNVFDNSTIVNSADMSTEIGKPARAGITAAELLGATQVMIPLTFGDAEAVRRVEFRFGQEFNGAGRRMFVSVKGYSYE